MGKLRGVLAAAACLLLLVTGPRAMAQAVFGQIVGTVTDPTGAAIPGATITVTDTAKGTSVTLQSNGAGEFTAEHLIPDTYTIKVAATGFKGYQQTAVQVFADTSPKVNAVLAVGGSDQVIEVNADQVPQLKTDKSDVATVFTATELEDLPIPDHNFTNLQLLLPGAVQLGWAHAASENPQGSKQIQIDGQAFGGVNYTLDGTDNQDAILGIIVINPNSESMSEAKIATQNFDAEFGKAVASVQTVQTKSGTNAFHGSLFDNRESNANLARDPFNGFAQAVPATPTTAAIPAHNIPYPSGLKNQFGGSIGGPIIKDRIFFFADYQGVRQKVGSTETASVPSLLALNSCTGTTAASNGQPGCDFSDYINAANVGSTNTALFAIYNNNQTSGTSTLGAQFPNNIIPLALVSPQAQNLFKLLLANKFTPNHNTGVSGNYNGLYNNFVGSGAGSFNSNQWDVRGDATISQKIHAFGRFSRFTDTLAGASLFGPAGGPGLGIAGYGGVSQGANDSLAMGVDIAVTQKLVTDVRLGYFRYDITTRKNDPGNTNLPFLGENVGTSALPVPVNYGTPDINIADLNVTNGGGANNAQNGGAQFGTGLNMNHCNCPLKEKEDQFQIVNNWTREIRTHAVKFGVDLRYARNLRVPSDNDRTGVNNFSEGPTSTSVTQGGQTNVVGGLGWATFILGDVSSFNRYTSASPTEPNAKEFQPRDFFYAQDTWRATPKLTVNAGLRYEYYAPERVNGVGNGALLNLDTGYINVAGSGGVPLNMGVSAPKFAFNPRMGVAYQIDNKTVIRAGYGRSFDLGVFGSTFGHVVTQNIPVLANQSVSAAGGPQSYAFNLSNPSATGNGATNPLYTFTSPTITNGQIAINAVIPGTNPSTTIGHGVNVKARPFTERLPTLDAWNLAVQRSITPTLSLEVSYVGNKGTHTLSDGDGNNTNPNEPGNFLPGIYTVPNASIGQIGLHFDPSGGNCITGATVAFVNCNNVSNPVPVTSSGATKSSTLLQRFVGGSKPACGGPCGWDQGISYYGDDQDTHYNALQMKLTRTFSKGYSVSANYAYQVGTDNASGYATWDKVAVGGNDSAIRRSAFTAYGLYKLPFGKNQMFLNQGGVLNYIVGGWELSPTVVYQSGLPFTLSYGSCGSYTQGPCYVNGKNQQLKTGKSGYAGGHLTYFTGTGGTSLCSTSAGFSGFTCSGLDSVGDGGRNNAWGPRFFNSDMSISKGVSIHERYEVKFRMDAYNAFNHINFGNPNGTIDQGSAGTIGGGPYPQGTGGTTNPRQLQFTVHLAF
jgi:hypothetical protein